MQNILVLGSVVFFVSSIIFLYQKKGAFNSPFLVSFITLISYIVMYEGQFVSMNSMGESLYWTRWIFYALSCTLLMLTIAKTLRFDKGQQLNAIYLTGIVMVTGALSSVYDGVMMGVMFVISSIAYLLLIAPILSSTQNQRSYIVPFIIFGWTLFPVIFVLSPEGFSLIDNPTAASVYLVLDLMTKVSFYLFGKNRLVNVV